MAHRIEGVVQRNTLSEALVEYYEGEARFQRAMFERDEREALHYSGGGMIVGGEIIHFPAEPDSLVESFEVD